ncbi:MAG: type III-A CRISPR-associated RAMP protein Csm4 [Synergistetes bacterium]|nr:MAG: CRISPR-associated protein, Csm4 family [bacterium 42_11]MBC7332126.1 type III-A CRISPR-associated RAMP protein Csm4 [Synergistota bacterium]MDK2872045.1 CRISPR-associated protein Csm4 [bacterium]
MMVFKLFPKEKTTLLWKDLCFGSSSLFGALSNGMVELYGEEELCNFAKAVSEDEIKISSLFPLLRWGGEDILFLPRPILPYGRKREAEGRSSEVKKVKKVKWLSFDAFFELGRSIVYDESEKAFYHGYDFSIDGIWEDIFYVPGIVKEELKKVFPFAKLERPHASIDRLDYSSNLFFTNEILVAYPLGFYFICELSEYWKEKLISVVKFIADEGLGGGRSEGMGIFNRLEIEERNIFPQVKSVVGYVGLSRVYPLRDEIDNVCYFSLVKDDGFVYMGGGRSIKKSRVMMLSEGSFYKGEVKGRLFEEKSGDIRIFRNGKSFLVPVGDVN